MRLLFAFITGGLFGAGLLISGMTDTNRIQGWLDIFGDWDPTLAFVLIGAILPMLVAWRVAAHRASSVLGSDLPGKPDTRLDARLLGGSALFGFGWALAGLCPGPAMASLSYGGVNGLAFFVSMIAGMIGWRLFSGRRAEKAA